MKTFMNMLVVVMYFLLADYACATDAKAADAKQPGYGNGFNTEFTYMYLNAHVNDMPLEIRDVPMHPDDSYGTPGPIEETSYNMNHAVDLSLMWTKESPSFNFGIGLNWMIFPWGIADAERNYRNAPGTDKRGYGAALTYIGLKRSGVIPSTTINFLDVFLNWTPIMKAEVAPFDGKLSDVWFGVSASYYAFDAQTGWDRYDSLEVRKNYTLMHVFPVRIYMSIINREGNGTGGSGLTFGVQLNPGSKTSWGEQVDISMPSLMPFVGYSARM